MFLTRVPEGVVLSFGGSQGRISTFLALSWDWEPVPALNVPKTSVLYSGT